MSGSVLASIIQNCKARNKCFTSSPQDATPVQGLHSTEHRLGQKEVEEERGGRGNRGGKKEEEEEEEEAVEERVKGFPAFQSI